MDGIDEDEEFCFVTLRSEMGWILVTVAMGMGEAKSTSQTLLYSLITSRRQIEGIK